MHNRYDTLFTLEVLHGKFPKPAPDKPMPPVPDFGFVPTSETRKLMRQNGMGLKPGTGSCTIFLEKSALPDGTFSARTKTGASMALNFFLLQTNGALIAETSPFNLPAPIVPPPIVPVASLPAFSGRKRVAYFNNRVEFVQPDGNYWLTKEAVGADSLASAAPASFDFKPKNGSATAVEAKSLAPGATAVSFEVNGSGFAKLDLPENGYLIAQKPGSDPPETIFFSPDTLPEGTVGVVQVFPFQTGSSPPVRRYQIFFK